MEHGIFLIFLSVLTISSYHEKAFFIFYITGVIKITTEEFLFKLHEIWEYKL